MGQIGRLEAIQFCPEKGGPWVAAEEQAVSAKQGLVGDYHGAGGDISLTLWTLEARKNLEESGFSGICFQRFQENLLVSGLDVSQLEGGERLTVGTLIFEVENRRKKCHPEICTLGDKRKDCLLRKQSLFVKPLTSGVLRVGDEIKSEVEKSE